MPGDPNELIAQLMAQQGGGPQPGPPMPQQGPPMPMPQGGPPTDEAMLATVQRGMGNEGGPPPGSGMRWENLQEDQDALRANPTPENIQAFAQYWGEENLPPGLGEAETPTEQSMDTEGGEQ